MTIGETTRQEYSYDSLYQLTWVSGRSRGYTSTNYYGDYEQSFTFDMLVNMQTKTSRTNHQGNIPPQLNYTLDYEYYPTTHKGNEKILVFRGSHIFFVFLIFLSCCNNNERSALSSSRDVNYRGEDEQILLEISNKLNKYLINYNDQFYFFNFDDEQSAQRIMLNNDFEVIELQKGTVGFDDVKKEYQFLFNDEVINLSPEKMIYYIRRYENSPELGQKLYYAFFKENEIEYSGNGYEEMLEKLNKSCLVIFECFGNRRFICKKDKILFEIPFFSDGPSHSTIAWSDNQVLSEGVFNSNVNNSRQNDQLDDVEEIRFFDSDPQPFYGEPFSYFLRIFYKNCNINKKKAEVSTDMKVTQLCQLPKTHSIM